MTLDWSAICVADSSISCEGMKSQSGQSFAVIYADCGGQRILCVIIKDSVLMGT